MNESTSELLASIAVNVAELKLLQSDMRHLAQYREELLRFLYAKEDFTHKAIV